MSYYLVALDPAINKAGIAVFAGMQLVGATSIHSELGPENSTPERILDMANRASRWVGHFVRSNGNLHVASECPKIYPPGTGKQPNPNTALVPQAQVAAALAALLGPETWTQYSPQEWKGQVPKKIHQQRIFRKLITCEQYFADASDPDLMDAIGIGLHHIGRKA